MPIPFKVRVEIRVVTAMRSVFAAVSLAVSLRCH